MSGYTKLKPLQPFHTPVSDLDFRPDIYAEFWEPAERRIVVRRDQLNGIASYAGTLLHEIGHMVSGTSDGTLDFEQVLTELLGRVASTVPWRP